MHQQIKFNSNAFDEEDNDSDDDFLQNKKRRVIPSYNKEAEGEEGANVERRELFGLPSPILEIKRVKPHTNYNPFAREREPPSLLSNSTIGSPEPSSDDSFMSIKNEKNSSYSSPIQQTTSHQTQQLCHEFKKTLSFVEFVENASNTPSPKREEEERGEDFNMRDFEDSPSTPPSSSILSARFPKSTMKSLRFHHKSQPVNEHSISRFQDEFEVLGKLGKGHFGEVFKVKNRLDGCMYAVKAVSQTFSGKSGRERVLKEVYALAAVVNESDNLHVVRYFSSWIDMDDRLYIQTELCDMSLEDMLKNHSSPVLNSAALESIACNVLRQLSIGLQGLHKFNVVHLDIKPGNILVKNGIYKLGDLGHVAMARSENKKLLPAPPPLKRNNKGDDDDDDEGERQINAVISVVNDIDEGDVRYMAKELLFENHENLPKADIFSLAVSVYEMFLLKPPPTSGEEWIRLREGHLSVLATNKMSNNFNKLIHLMMHPDPNKRPTADALVSTGGPGGVLIGLEEIGRDQLKREIELLRGLHPAHVLKRSNTM